MRVAAWLFAALLTLAPALALAAPAAPAAPEFERVALAEPTAVSTQPGAFSPEAIAAIEKALGAGAAASVAETAVPGRWPKKLGAPQYGFAHYARLTLRRICDLGGSKYLLVARALENAHLEPDVRPEADVYFVVDAAGVVPRPAPKGWPKGFGNQLAWLIDDLFAVDSRLAAVDRPTARHKTSVAQSEPIEGAVEELVAVTDADARSLGSRRPPSAPGATDRALPVGSATEGVKPKAGGRPTRATAAGGRYGDKLPKPGAARSPGRVGCRRIARTWRRSDPTRTRPPPAARSTRSSPR